MLPPLLTFLSIYLSNYLTIYPSIYLSIFREEKFYFSLSTLFLYISLYLSLSIYPSIYLTYSLTLYISILCCSLPVSSSACLCLGQASYGQCDQEIEHSRCQAAPSIENRRNAIERCNNCPIIITIFVKVEIRLHLRY